MCGRISTTVVTALSGEYRKGRSPSSGRVSEHRGELFYLSKRRAVYFGYKSIVHACDALEWLDMHSVCIKRSMPALGRPKLYFHRRGTPLPLSSTLFRSLLPTPSSPVIYCDWCMMPGERAVVQTAAQCSRAIPSSAARVFTSANALSRELRDFTAVPILIPRIFSGNDDVNGE